MSENEKKLAERLGLEFIHSGKRIKSKELEDTLWIDGGMGRLLWRECLRLMDEVQDVRARNAEMLELLKSIETSQLDDMPPEVENAIYNKVSEIVRKSSELERMAKEAEGRK